VLFRGILSLQNSYWRGAKTASILSSMALRIEFDPVNKILLIRFEGQLTDELVAEYSEAIRKYWTAADASAGVVDFSSVSELSLSAECIRQLAKREPCIPDAPSRPRVIVAPTTLGFGLARMFQILGEDARPLLSVAHTLDEAFAALGVQSPQFEPLKGPSEVS